MNTGQIGKIVETRVLIVSQKTANLNDAFGCDAHGKLTKKLRRLDHRAVKLRLSVF